MKKTTTKKRTKKKTKKTDLFSKQVPTKATKVVKLPQIADPTIDQVLQQFLDEQREQLTGRTLAKYEDVLDLLRHHLNGYAYEGLSKAESSLFDKCFNATGDEHREFCQLFGPEKIVENLGSFLGYFMIHKVIGGADLKRAAGTVAKKLSKWLVAKGHASEESACDVDEDARHLPQAERAAQLLFEAADAVAVNPNDLDDEDYVDFDHYTVAKIEPGKLWLDIYDEAGEKTLGPISVPKEATKLLQKGWDISCALGRIRGKWRLIEVANVYPL